MEKEDKQTKLCRWYSNSVINRMTFGYLWVKIIYKKEVMHGQS
jgi:hypothetical protein